MKKILSTILILALVLFGAIPVQASGTPTGGAITTDGDYTIHTFSSSGTFTVYNSGNVEVLVVAGGGGGGGGAFAGGGGAGGMVKKTSHALSTGDYSVIIGTGGTGGYGDFFSATDGSDGYDSLFDSIIANGGGGGSKYRNAPNLPGHDGGSGGGGGSNTGVGGTATQGYSNGGTGYGNNGGNGTGDGGGGGGGAGSVGGNGTSSGGIAGYGRDSSISGLSITYATGGHGGAYNITSGTNGTYGRGNGGEAGDDTHDGGDGGSGIVIIRYLTSDFLGPTPTPSSTPAPITTQDIIDVVHNLFSNLVEFFGNVIFHSDVAFLEHTSFNKDMAGQVTIASGTTSASVAFEHEYSSAPVVNLTLRSPINLSWYRIANESTTGFTVQISRALQQDVMFNWTAIEVSTSTPSPTP